MPFAQPTNLFASPFAANGNKQIIPPTTAGPGRATLDQGFPQETQLPLSMGGIAPNRTDFNGLLYMLSAFAFWQQSGGQFSYNATLQYTTPNIVYGATPAKLWWCLQNNGPGTTLGVVAPGTNATVWIDLFTALSGMTTGGGGGIMAEVGDVKMIYDVTVVAAATSSPNALLDIGGWYWMNGATYDVATNPGLYVKLGKNTLPDMRGLFARGYDPSNVKDPNGSTRGLGSAQGDAIRNFTGTFPTDDFHLRPEVLVRVTGCFTYVNVESHRGFPNDTSSNGGNIRFDASRVVPTAPENRPVNMNLIYCIKHD